MHPVLPSTIVRGPAALAMSFISSADSHPWHVRCPEVKNSSSGSFLTDLKGSSFCVGSICTKVDIGCLLSFRCVKTHQRKSYPRSGLFTQTYPLRQRLLFSGSRLIDRLPYLFHVGAG